MLYSKFVKFTSTKSYLLTHSLRKKRNIISSIAYKRIKSSLLSVVSFNNQISPIRSICNYRNSKIAEQLLNKLIKDNSIFIK